MWKRVLAGLTLVILVLNMGLPGMLAQEVQVSGPRAWIPAGYSGFLSLRTRNLSDTFMGLNMALLVGSLLQPTRADLQSAQSFDSFFPLTQLDVEGVSFGQDIFPWLGDEMIVAYKNFASGLVVDIDDLLFILPTDNPLQSASRFSRIVQGQDLLQRETYRAAALYIGDKTSFALAAEGVIIGQYDEVKAVLDLMAGEGERLVDAPAYHAVTAVSPSDALIFAYLGGREALATISFLVSGSAAAEPLLGALGEALSEVRGAAAFEQVLLGDALDGVGLSLLPDTLRLGAVRATLTLYDADQPTPVAIADFNADLLKLVPQNTLMVQSGTDAPGAVWNVLYALPLTNFAGQILSAFPVTPSPATLSGAVAVPQAADMTRAVQGLLETLRQTANFRLEEDLLAHLGHSYLVALLPRPNNPTPFFNTPYDVLVVAETVNSSAALQGVTRLTEVILGLGTVETTVEETNFNTIQLANGQPLIRLGLVDNLLVIATGDALPPALAARRGDNRLVSRAKWESISRDALPHFYLDIPAFYNTFLAQPGGAQFRQANQLGAWTTYLGDGVYQVQVLVTLAGEIGGS